MTHTGLSIGTHEYRWSDNHPNYVPCWEVKTTKGKWQASYALRDATKQEGEALIAHRDSITFQESGT